MKSFLFIKNCLKLIQLNNSFEKKSFSFVNSLNSKNVMFDYKEIKNFFLLKKKLQKFYLSHLRGFVCILELIGLGFSVTAKENLLRFNVGYNHSIYYKIPIDIIIRSKRKSLFIFSHSFFSLRKAVVDLKNFRKLSIYKLKGIKEKNDLYIKKN